MGEKILGYDNINDKWRSIKTDEEGNSSSINKVHLEIHKSNAYVCSVVQDITGSSSYQILLSTPPTAIEIHIRYAIATEAEATFTIYEGGAATVGTVLPCFNRKRDSANSTTMNITHTPGITTTGTVIFQTKTGSGNKTGGEIDGLDELILKPSELYVLRVNNDVGSANYAAIQTSWYEET